MPHLHMTLPPAASWMETGLLENSLPTVPGKTEPEFKPSLSPLPPPPLPQVHFFSLPTSGSYSSAGPLSSPVEILVTANTGKDDIRQIIPGTEHSSGDKHHVPCAQGARQPRLETVFIVREPQSLLTLIFVVIVLRQSLSL